MKAVLLCVATEKGYEVLQVASGFADELRVHVCTFDESLVARSFTDSIRSLADELGFPQVRWNDFRRDSVGYLQSHDIDGLLCIGWRFLIPAAAVTELRGNAIAAHDSLLPHLRGFAPLPTALIVGDPQVGVTFLRIGNRADDGDILWQDAIDVRPNDTIGDLIRRTVPVYRAGAERFLRGDIPVGRPQDESQATYSIWRDELDYWIDWREDADRIERSIRALGDPYLGARAKLHNSTIVLHDAEVVADVPFAIRQPGKVWSLDDHGCPTVVCGRGMLKVLAASCDGQSVLPLNSIRVRFRGATS